MWSGLDLDSIAPTSVEDGLHYGKARLLLYRGAGATLHLFSSIAD
jgi:hypothetical protein